MRSLPIRGMTLIDVVIGTALVLVIFSGLFGILQASVKVSGLAKIEATATEVSESQMEYLRSLSYDALGTVGGIPAGLIPQTATSTNGGLTYTVRTYIEYADDSADGLGVSDTNHITTDYKHLKVTVSYVTNDGVSHNVTLVSNAAPPGVETTTGGGTLSIVVNDSSGQPLPGASVEIKNTSTNPTIDLFTYSDTVGTAVLGGAPTSTQYQVYVSKSGYSSAQNYPTDAQNQNPNPGYFTVVKDTTTSGTFAIDLLASLTFETFSPIAPATSTDAFADSSHVQTMTNTSAGGGALTLSGGAGNYASSGTALSTTTSPAYLASWTNASASRTTPAGTSALFSVADGSGALLPDTVVPGNATGFTTFVNLSSVSTTTYPALALIGTLSSNSASSTPSFTRWSVAYTAGPLPLPNVSFTLTGTKTIGSTGGGAPIYKTTISTTTDSTGVRTLPLEWDLYQLTLPGHTVVSENPTAPYSISAGGSTTASVVVQ